MFSFENGFKKIPDRKQVWSSSSLLFFFLILFYLQHIYIFFGTGAFWRIFGPLRDQEGRSESLARYEIRKEEANIGQQETSIWAMDQMGAQERMNSEERVCLLTISKDKQFI